MAAIITGANAFHNVDSKTLAYHLNFLNPARISYGRELRGLTKKALADRIGKSAAAITQYEAGMKPTMDSLDKMAEALDLPIEFFSAQGDEFPTPPLEEFHFRARASVTQSMKTKSRRYAESVMAIFRFLEDYGVEFPKENVTPAQKRLTDGITVSEAAAIVRHAWGLKNRPIHDLFALMETNGIFIILLDNEYDALEACATWFGDRPCIMLAQNKFQGAASRIHFDLCHELGHLMLHDASYDEVEKEPQAHEFASAFLMPAETFIPASPPRWNLDLFLDIKRKWHVSMQAALRRSRDLGVISESSYRWGMIDLSKQGFRVKEPGEFPMGEPSLLAQAADLVKGKLTLDELAAGISMYPGEVEKILIAQRVEPDTLEKMKIKRSQNSGKIVSFRQKND